MQVMTSNQLQEKINRYRSIASDEVNKEANELFTEIADTLENIALPLALALEGKI